MPPNSDRARYEALYNTSLPRDFVAIKNTIYDSGADVYKIKRYPNAATLGFDILDEMPDYTITTQELVDADRLFQAAEAYAQTTEYPEDYIYGVYRRAKYYATQGYSLPEAVRQAYKDKFGARGERWLQQYEKDPGATLNQLIATNPRAKQMADAYQRWKNEYGRIFDRLAQKQREQQENNLWQSIMKPAETTELPAATLKANTNYLDLLGK